MSNFPDSTFRSAFFCSLSRSFLSKATSSVPALTVSPSLKSTLSTLAFTGEKYVLDSSLTTVPLASTVCWTSPISAFTTSTCGTASSPDDLPPRTDTPPTATTAITPAPISSFFLDFFFFMPLPPGQNPHLLCRIRFFRP